MKFALKLWIKLFITEDIFNMGFTDKYGRTGVILSGSQLIIASIINNNFEFEFDFLTLNPIIFFVLKKLCAFLLLLHIFKCTS